MTTVNPGKWGWWNTANVRRCGLLFQKHMGDGIAPEEEVELAVLDDLADAIINRVGPDLSIIAPVIGAVQSQVKDASNG